ncbi:SH3 domain-binding glutamic acid-rich protein homolog [Limulus polyphemus]|uniref:SH3 domain-binding glutamic acid-rich protein homolog n=1 Tax=Limulus polyphemus TaxID=6850 RepID=A0ABM1BCE0_LIMPO|nr:SH3 domain-binding glutamic acid-rich protein homolog [Limulus polyphemus]
MVVKVYVSGISASKEVKKHQQRVLMILDSLKVCYETVDITEPGKEDQRSYMQENCKKSSGRSVLPPQFFNDEDYCGDYEDFELANEDDELMKFLKLGDQVSIGKITLNESNSQTTDADNADEMILQNGSTSQEASAPKEEVTEDLQREIAEEAEEKEFGKHKEEFDEGSESKEAW